ncbi:MAG: PEP/pyruvate-binding domain-containing protein, partial [Verrucomicrobiia bacterium]
MIPHILPLELCQDPETVGGKAVNLGRLLRAELPVPGGFAITTAAFRASFGGGMSPEIARAIVDAWEGMGAPPVAVRSSATAEDAAGASMAGQYETILGVRTGEELLEAVKRCWAAVASPRALAYLA